jgi:hypothetical protein
VQPLCYGTIVTRFGVGKEKGEEREGERKKERRKENRKMNYLFFRNCDM